jgi:transposase
MLAGMQASIRCLEPIHLIFGNGWLLRLRRVGLSARQAAQFGVDASTAIRWVGRRRKTGSLRPSEIGGYKPRAIAGGHRTWLLQRIREKDFTLRGLVAELAARGLKVDYRSVWSFVHDEKLSFKKSVVAGERERPDVARRRRNGAALAPSVSERPPGSGGVGVEV